MPKATLPAVLMLDEVLKENEGPRKYMVVLATPVIEPLTVPPPPGNRPPPCTEVVPLPVWVNAGSMVFGKPTLELAAVRVPSLLKNVADPSR
jgi:hypothetical protein